MASKILQKEAVTSAPIADVWNAWTTPQGLVTFLAPKVNIRLEIGGPFEIFFNPEAPLGFRGTEGCKILGLEPMKRLSFDWRAPPQFPNVRRQKTLVDVNFEQVLALTKVRIVHSGWREGEEWDETYEFFERAWDHVLARMQQRFSSGPINWKIHLMSARIPSSPERSIRDHIPAEPR